MRIDFLGAGCGSFSWSMQCVRISHCRVLAERSAAAFLLLCSASVQIPFSNRAFSLGITPRSKPCTSIS